MGRIDGLFPDAAMSALADDARTWLQERFDELLAVLAHGPRGTLSPTGSRSRRFARCTRPNAPGTTPGAGAAVLFVACAGTTPAVMSAHNDGTPSSAAVQGVPPARAAGGGFSARAPFVVPAVGAMRPSPALPPVDVTTDGVSGRLFRAPTHLHRMHCGGRERRAGESVEQCARRIFWALTPRDIAAFEAAFARTDPRAWMTPCDDPALRARLPADRREYVGIALNGEALVVVTLLCPGAPQRTDGEMYEGRGGGVCVLRATLHLDGDLRVWASGDA